MKQRKDKKTIMGIDIGGTKIAAALVSSGRLMTPVYSVHTLHGSKILNQVSKFYEKFSKKYLISGIGISTTRIVNYH